MSLERSRPRAAWRRYGRILVLGTGLATGQQAARAQLPPPPPPMPVKADRYAVPQTTQFAAAPATSLPERLPAAGPTVGPAPAPEQLPLAGNAAAPPDPVPDSPPASAPDANKVTIDKTEFERLFDDAMKRREEKKKLAEEEAKKKADAEGYVVGSDLTMKASWRNGVWIESPNSDFKFHFGGMLQYDAAFYQAGPQVQFAPGGVGELGDGVNLRRARLRAEGTFYEVIDFVAEYEFANGFATSTTATQSNTFLAPGPTDFYLNVKSIPVIGNVRIGNQKEPFSLEHMIGDNYLDFLERSYLFDFAQPSRFNNGFTPGITVWNTQLGQHMTWAVGVFKNDSDLFGFGLGDGKYAVDGRMTFLPLYEDDGNELIHVGGAASHRDPVNNSVQISVHESVRNAPLPLLNQIVNTGLIPCSSQDLFNAELAGVWGPLRVQAEWTGNRLSNAALPGNPVLGTAWFQGYYVEAMYFLTGEHRPYNRTTGAFDRVVPLEPYYLANAPCGWVHGLGAWEVGVRYTYLDVTNAGIKGGVLNDITVGLNWYLTSNAKLQWNYDWVKREDTVGNGDGVIQAFGMRLAYDF
jgi:phosphate-selective porin OprO/OprP